MDQAARRLLIDRYRNGVSAVKNALAGATEEELDRRIDDDWSSRMVVHHLADSETNSYVRLRQLLAQDDARLQGYDEAKFARTLHYDRPIETSLSVFEAVRASSGELLERLGEDDWGRTGTHSESGPYSVEDWLAIYADHAEAHADQITRARAGA